MSRPTAGSSSLSRRASRSRFPTSLSSSRARRSRTFCGDGRPRPPGIRLTEPVRFSYRLSTPHGREWALFVERGGIGLGA